MIAETPLARPAPEALPAPFVSLAPGVQLYAPAHTPAAARVLAPEAVALLARLHRHFEPARQALLADRAARQRAWDRGEAPGYLAGDEGRAARETDWQVAPLPGDLLCRRVEITGPVSDAKMVINMLSRTADGHRADAAMLDFEDAMKPSWANVVRGVENLIGAVEGTLTYDQPATPGRPARQYALDPDDRPLIMVRVRGLHLDETNLRVDGRPVAAGLLDFVLSTFHTARRLCEQGRTPKYYLPKCEHYREARWWNAVFSAVEEALGLVPSTLRATLLIETLPAAYQMEEILYEMRDHAAGLNGGRWDKIFSDIKVFLNHPDRVLADRASISMNRPWMKHYVLELIRVCHRHGAFGMGGMAAFTPGRTPERRAEQTEKVIADKTFEAGIGHDGCWVSHPYFIGPAMAAFPRRNQLDVQPGHAPRPDIAPRGTPPYTRAGLRKNVRVGIAYLTGWFADTGCVAWEDLMEDLATLEISRAQTAQWLRHGLVLDDGSPVTPGLVRRVFADELAAIQAEMRAAGASADRVAAYADAADVAADLFTEPAFRPFLTLSSPPAGLFVAAERERLRTGP